jgi:hypothetical protein
MPFTLFGLLNVATGAELDTNLSILGTMSRNFCTISGTNALTFTQISNTPVLAAYSNNIRLVGIAPNTNTGAATAGLGTLGLLGVVKDTPSGPVALTGGEIVAGNIIALDYDSTLNAGGGGWHLLPPVGAGSFPTLLAIAGSSRNLVITQASNTSLTITADQIAVAVSLSGNPFLGTSINQTLNAATTGANGLDTGALGASSFYSIYEIYNPTSNTFACLMCLESASSGTIYSGAHMPSGYTASALIGYWITNSSSHLFIANIIDRKFFYQTPVNVATGVTIPGSLTSQSVSGPVPAPAKTVDLIVGTTTSAGSTLIAVAGDSVGSGLVIVDLVGESYNALFGFVAAGIAPGIPLLTPQAVFWEQSQSTTLIGRMSVTAFTF